MPCPRWRPRVRPSDQATVNGHLTLEQKSSSSEGVDPGYLHVLGPDPGCWRRRPRVASPTRRTERATTSTRAAQLEGAAPTSAHPSRIRSTKPEERRNTSMRGRCCRRRCTTPGVQVRYDDTRGCRQNKATPVSPAPRIAATRPGTRPAAIGRTSCSCAAGHARRPTNRRRHTLMSSPTTSRSSRVRPPSGRTSSGGLGKRHRHENTPGPEETPDVAHLPGWPTPWDRPVFGMLQPRSD